jgi:hypothetical protein
MGFAWCVFSGLHRRIPKAGSSIYYGFTGRGMKMNKRIFECPLGHTRLILHDGVTGELISFCPECNRKFEENQSEVFEVGEQYRCELGHADVLFAPGLTFTHPFFLCPICSGRFGSPPTADDYLAMTNEQLLAVYNQRRKNGDGENSPDWEKYELVRDIARGMTVVRRGGGIYIVCHRDVVWVIQLTYLDGTNRPGPPAADEPVEIPSPALRTEAEWQKRERELLAANVALFNELRRIQGYEG